MDIIAAMIVGLIAGALFQLLRADDDASGLAVTGTLGIIGALAALWLGGWDDGNQEGVGILAASAGAAVILTAYRLVGGRA
jgi:uncharacterized membrane protein YeaQ/YmgE (transglycosylase-associated protein family)